MTDSSNTQRFTLRYPQPSDYHHDHVQLFSHLDRDAVSFQAKVKEPMAFREALGSLFSIVSSDYRYVPKDRTAYTAFMQMRRNHQNKGLAKAHQAYYRWLWENDPQAWLILDPILHVHPNGLSLEVFSKDEGSYAQLHFDSAFFENQGEVEYGTTNIDFSEALSKAIEQIRSSNNTQLSIGQSALEFATKGAENTIDEQVIEKKIQVPTSWLRGFLQVQSSAQLPSDQFSLAPIDLYNCLYHLRMNADIKGKRRGLRIELIPNEYPRLVLEPNDTVITTTAQVYQGKQAKIIRLWGRRRLSLLQRFLPFTQQIDVSLLGNGMPSFWTLKGKHMTMSLAITGFTASNWSQALNFDLLLPRKAESDANLQQVVEHLKAEHFGTLAHISKATGLSKKDCNSALQQACQQGLLVYHLHSSQYTYRPLTQEPLDMDQFQFRQPSEALAYDLVQRQKAIEDLNLKMIPNEGIEISAEITVKEDKRNYLSRLKISEEGNVSKAECSCHQMMKHGLTQGACSHLIALRLRYAAEQANPDLKKITQETRTFMRRKKQSQTQLQVTLNQKRLLILSQQKQQEKQQQFAFNSVDEARTAYLEKIAQLELTGFIEG